MVRDMQTASRQLSKRQMTWFRGDPLYQWVDAARPLDDIVDEITASVQLDQHPGARMSSLMQCGLHVIMALDSWHACRILYMLKLWQYLEYAHGKSMMMD